MRISRTLSINALLFGGFTLALLLGTSASANAQELNFDPPGIVCSYCGTVVGGRSAERYGNHVFNQVFHTTGGIPGVGDDFDDNGIVVVEVTGGAGDSILTDKVYVIIADAGYSVSSGGSGSGGSGGVTISISGSATSTNNVTVEVRTTDHETVYESEAVPKAAPLPTSYPYEEGETVLDVESPVDLLRASLRHSDEEPITTPNPGPIVMPPSPGPLCGARGSTTYRSVGSITIVCGGGGRSRGSTW